MSKNEKPKIDDLPEELAFWNTFRKVYRARGVDIARQYAEWAAAIERGLTSPGPREDFAELCKAGCLPQGLAALILLFEYSPSLEQFWTELVGQPSNRDKATRALENAAQTLETLYAPVIALGNDAEIEQFAKIGRVPLSRIVSELRVHIRFVNFARSLSADTETRSPEELVRYLLTSYVRRMTGHSNDRCVSSLVGTIVGFGEDSITAQRMWRFRNYERMEKHYSWMVKFLVAMSVVMESTA